MVLRLAYPLSLDDVSVVYEQMTEREEQCDTETQCGWTVREKATDRES